MLQVDENLQRKGTGVITTTAYIEPYQTYQPPKCEHYVDVKILNGIIITFCVKCGKILSQEKVN